MGSTVGADNEGSVDVELNVVPFIDLMSCLTAFLLVTAVWSQYSQVNTKPKGLGRDATKPIDEEIPVNASILLTKNEIWVGLTVTGPTQIPNIEADRYNWDALEQTLAEFRVNPVFAGRADIELAAEDEVDYQTIVTAMDIAIATCTPEKQEECFEDIGFVDPQSLSVKFKE